MDDGVIRQFKVVGGIETHGKPLPNATVIDTLEVLLAQAKSGELQSLFVVGAKANGNVMHSWSSARHSAWEMLGMIESSKLDFNKREVERDGEEI